MRQVYVGGCEMFFDGPTAGELFRDLSYSSEPTVQAV